MFDIIIIGYTVPTPTFLLWISECLNLTKHIIKKRTFLCQSEKRTFLCQLQIDIGITHVRKRSRSRSTPYGRWVSLFCRTNLTTLDSLNMLAILLWDFSYLARPIEEVKEATQRQRQRALEAAVDLQNNLKSENPSFVKTMVRSHVYSCFWLVCYDEGNVHFKIMVLSSYLNYPIFNL